ncbi:hypothetical protein SteCoe_37144 [Stentor coeruleus]|uniref:Cyclic nucleotide-binding domain-containing protein n=1 Tax=Stentor coeruleus TaxID=5963 RepID=A0A1R2ANN3_9CILI|nr:hypothetical protein SteCoe_37144 [Stentor coeruleus]
MIKRRPIDEIKESLLRDEKNEGDINKLKMIFKENPLLRQIPPNQRADFCTAMKLFILAPLEVLITDKVRKPDLYIILDGKVFLRNINKEESVLEAYDIFGYTFPFTGQKWTPSRVTAREVVSIISIPRGPLKKAMEKVRKVQDNTKLLEFLVKTVPGVRQLGQAGKERVLSLFEKCQFKSGDTLLREGEKAPYAFIIEEGECKVVGSQNPIKRPGSAPARGLMSKTTSCYNLGVIMPGEWAGEDSILLSKPMEFSVIASSHLLALRISKEKFSENLTKDTQNLLKENLGNKMRWREIRKQNISNAIIENVIDEEGRAEVASYEDAEKNYPKATKLALVNIRKQEIEKQDLYEKSQTQNIGSLSNDFAPNLLHNQMRSRPQTGKTRPISALTEKKARSVYNVSASVKNLIYFQPFIHKSMQFLNFADKSSNPEKVQLYTANTLGYSLIPTIPKRPTTAKIRETAVVPVVVKNFNTGIKSQSTYETFAQQVRKGRPDSPNPADVWAKKQGVSLKKINLLATEYT